MAHAKLRAAASREHAGLGNQGFAPQSRAVLHLSCGPCRKRVIELNFTKWGIKFFGIHISPLFSENEALYRLFNRIHVYTSYFFSALIAIHIGGALKHWLVDRDGVLQRMLPGG